MNSGKKLGKRVFRRLVAGFVRADLLVITATAILMTGCGSTASLVKQSLDPKPLVANAISKAVCLTDFSKKSCAPQEKSGSFPPLPSDESAPTVRKFVREYAYGQRETMKRYLAQADQYLPMVKTMAGDNGLPQDLAYLFMLESGANPEARSPANALGMWQFMPATARSYGLRVDSWVDERLDPKKSTQAALTYLKDLYGMFGCWRLALSAYNSGENKLNKVLCQEDASEYDEICSSRRLKRETREFLPRFQAIAHIAKNREKYGFAPFAHTSEDSRHELIAVEGSYSLDRLAEVTGVSTDRLAELNPALIRGTTPPAPYYSVRVPIGKKEVLLTKLKEIPSEPTKRTVVHTVNRGDNLARILKRYGVDRSQLAGLNPDVNLRRKLKQGAKIIVPAEKAQTRKEKSLRKNKRLSLVK
ncbi:MAG TPA: transglycosylase SLT domain-containing protein [Desulfomonilaceae bacterium]|nr:transglycosylase SLT domain-containing protein [Desulfomonilaceae bacterium]